MTEDEQCEVQRLALLHLLNVECVKADEWWKDLPTLADRLMKTGAVTVDAVKVMRGLVHHRPVDGTFCR